MILSTILSLFTGLLTNVLLFFVGKLLVHNKRFKNYLGITSIEETIPAEGEPKEKLISHPFPPIDIERNISIESVLITIGFIIQWIAIFSGITGVVVGITMISRT